MSEKQYRALKDALASARMEGYTIITHTGKDGARLLNGEATASERASESVTGIGHSDIRGLVTNRSMVRRERCRLKAWIAKHCADIGSSQIARTVNVRSSFGMPFGISVRLLCSP